MRHLLVAYTNNQAARTLSSYIVAFPSDYVLHRHCDCIELRAVQHSRSTLDDSYLDEFRNTVITFNTANITQSAVILAIMTSPLLAVYFDTKV